MSRIKQRQVTEDAEMLAATAKIVKEAPQVEQTHSEHLKAQVVPILQDG